MTKKIDVLLGLQWGDEGKGKIVDLLAPNYNVVARFQGGPNAGHTLEFDKKKYVLHTIPSGVFQPQSINYIGNGVVLDPCVFKQEIENLSVVSPWIYENLYISMQAHLILPTHRLLDAAYEQAKGKNKIGSTLKGIGPTYTDKISRQGIRVGDIFQPDFNKKYLALTEKHKQILSLFNYPLDHLSELENKWFEALEILKKFKLTDGISFIQKQIEENKKILAEGAQGSMLDIDFGSYPFVTSSNTIAAGACIGLGIAPKQIGDVIGVAKAYCTRVGNGPFPTELNDNIGNKLRIQGNEFGSTTGRPRRCGWLDLVALKFAVTISGVNRLIITKADVISTLDEIKVAVAYRTNDGEITYIPYNLDDIKQPIFKSFKGWKKDICNIRNPKDLPKELLQYIAFIEEYTQVKVEMVSVGPDRNANVYL
ncbi:MAG: adenylosuccinate synthase [Bacteroidales bacterium]